MHAQIGKIVTPLLLPRGMSAAPKREGALVTCGWGLREGVLGGMAEGQKRERGRGEGVGGQVSTTTVAGRGVRC